MISDIIELNFPKKDGKQYATLTHATANIADMGEKSITTQVKIDGKIVPDFSFDWAVAFQGEKYIMPLRIPQGTKENTSLNSTIDLTFQHWAIYQLKRWPFVTIQQIAAGTYLPDEEVATVQLNLKDFCILFGQVLEYYYGGAITIDFNDDPVTGWQYKQEATRIEISHTKIWNVLIDAFHDKYGVRWEIKAASDNSNTVKGGERYVIRVGYPTTEVDHIFEYGFEGGLLKVERQVQSEEIRNILKGRGGETNIPFRYFKDADPNNPDFRPDPDWVEELANIHFTNLMPATFRSYVQGWKAAHISKYPGYKAVGESNAYAPWAYRKGYTDTKFAPVEFVADEITIDPETADPQVEILPGYSPYVKKGSSLDKYGPLPDTLDNNDDIYPTLQGTGMDIAVAVEQIESDDVAESTESDAQVRTLDRAQSAVKKVAKTERAELIIRSNNFLVETDKTANLDEGVKNIIVTKNGTKLVWRSDEKWGPHVGNFQVNVDNGAVTIEDTSLTVVNANTGATISASDIPGGVYYFQLKLTVHNTANESYNVTIECPEPKLTISTIEDRKWRNTFDIWVKNIWNTQKGVAGDGTTISGETDSQYAERVWKPVLGDREKNTAKVVFTSGDLALSEDYEFTIVDFPEPTLTPESIKEWTDKNGVNHSSHWKIKLAKSEAELEATGLYVPSKNKQGKSGDRFVFIGTEMTHVPYVVDAEERLDDWKKDQLGEVKEIKPTAVVTTDRVRLNNESKPNALINQLRVGNSLRLFDKRFFNEPGKAYETLYLQSITYTYREPSSDDAALNPDVEIVLGNEYTTSANPVSMMQGEISALQKQVGSISNVEQIVRAVGDRLYLRKDGISDRSLSPTQFFSLLTSGDFRAGIIGGAGWGFYKDENGNWVMETDRVNVRQEMQVNTLVINQAEGRGGMEIDTAAFIDGVTRVVDTDAGYVCYFDQKEGSVANLFHIDDVAYCNCWTPENTDLKFYKRRVVAVGADNITLSKTDVNGSGIPAEGDNVIHFGNYTDKTRQYVKVRDVVGGGYERYIEELNSVNAAGVEYYFVGKQAGDSRWFVGNKDLIPYSGQGDGSYIEYINRKFNLNNVSLSVTSTIGNKSIGEYVGDAAKDAADKANQELEQQIKELQDQVDGVIESFNGFGAPTLSNFPANEWTTDEDRKKHNRDIYTDITPYVDNATTPTAGQSWKWYYNSSTDYGWTKIADSDAVKALQLAHMSIRETDVLYISHTSQTIAPELPAVNINGVITDYKGWQTEAPTWSATKYIWQTTYVRKGDGSAYFSDPTCISGRNGVNGRGILKIEEQYYLSDSQTQLTGGSWKSEADKPTWVASKFMWTRTKITYSDNAVDFTGALCVTGTPGTSVLAQYSADGTSWHPTFATGDIWMRTSDDGGLTWSSAIRIVGEKGADGADGQWRKFQWAKNNSTTTAPISGWQDNLMTAAAGEYVWMRSGTVVPPAMTPTSWGPATRLTGDKGADGQSVYILDIDNEVSGVICNASGTVTGSYPTPQASVYKGGTKLTSGIAYSIPQKTGISTVNITTAGAISMSGMTADKAEITVQARVDNVTLTSVISLYKVKPGASGQAAVVYSIEPSVNNITKSMSGALSATSVTCSVYKITGNSATALTNDHKLTYQRLPDGATGTLTRNAGVSAPVSILADTEAVIFELKNSAGALLDRERVPVLTDASGLMVGGVNLLRNTNQGVKTWQIGYKPGDGVFSMDADSTGKGVKFTNAATTTNTGWQMIYKPVQSELLKTGIPYRLSFRAKASTAGMWFTVQIRHISQGNYLTDSTQVLLSTSEKRYEIPMFMGKDPDAGVAYSLVLYIYSNTVWNELWLSDVKLEVGNVATEWTPSPLDFDYLTSALAESTVTKGGLILTSLIKVGINTNPDTLEQSTMAGISGIYNDTPGARGGIAVWTGGGMVDLGDPDHDTTATPATTVLRHDGSAYFCNNTVRLAQNVMEVGDSVELNKDGLLLNDSNGKQRLRISNTTVGDDIDIDAANIALNLNTSLNVSLGLRSRVVTIPGDSSGTLVQTTKKWWVIKGGKTTYTYSIPGTLTAGASLSLTSCRVDIDTYVVGQEKYPIEGIVTFKVGRYGTNNAKEYIAGGSVSVAINEFGRLYVPKENIQGGRYFVEVQINTSTQETTQQMNKSASLTVNGTAYNAFESTSVLGNDGLLSIWGNTGLLVNKDKIVMRALDYVLRITSTGIHKSTDGGKSWTIL